MDFIIHIYCTEDFLYLLFDWSLCLKLADPVFGLILTCTRAWTICPRGYFISVFHKYEFSILLFRLLQYRNLLCSIPTKQQVPRASSATVLSEWYMNNTRGPNVVPEALMWRDEDEQKENPK